MSDDDPTGNPAIDETISTYLTAVDGLRGPARLHHTRRHGDVVSKAAAAEHLAGFP